MRRRFAMLPALAVAVAAEAGEFRDAGRLVARAAAASRGAVVVVITPNERDFDQTGVVVAPGGIVLTVRSTLRDDRGALPEEVRVRFSGSGDLAAAKLIAQDEATDTAVLEAGGSPKYLRIAPPESAALGAFVLLPGNAFGQGRESTPTVSLGVVSGVVRERGEVCAILASALVNPGSIGAPLVDAEGELVGIVTARVTPDGGQSVAVPYEAIRRAYAAQPAVRRLLDRPAPPRPPRGTFADHFAAVARDVVARGRAALVGVRSAAKAAEAPPRDGAPKPIGGKLPAFDRSSGLVVSEDGYVLCPIRVTGWPAAPRAMTVDLLDGSSHSARLVGLDERVRLALLKIEARGLAVLPPSPVESRRRGALAFALGFPHGDPATTPPQVTWGIVSRTGALGALHPAFDAVQTDAAVNGANRGGPLLDLEGRLLGVLLDVDDTEPRGYFARGPAQYGANAGLGFAVPPERIADVVERLARGVTLRAAWLGVAADAAEGGVRVLSVEAANASGEATAAAAAGLRPGDIVVSVGGVETKDPAALRRALGGFAAGDVIEIVFLRGGAETRVSVALGAP